MKPIVMIVLAITLFLEGCGGVAVGAGKNFVHRLGEFGNSASE